jgi:hypothetical protein
MTLPTAVIVGLAITLLPMAAWTRRLYVRLQHFEADLKHLLRHNLELEFELERLRQRHRQ